MRTVYLDVGPMAHLAGNGTLKGHSLSNPDELIYGPGMGIIVLDDTIEKIAPSAELQEEFGAATNKPEISSDLSVVSLHGNAVIPGLVDGHTHLLWAGDRSRELSWRHAGKSYKDISELGGGIQDTVRSTSKATDEQLLKLGYERMRSSLRSGTTHLETKSGYGLSTESELRLLRIASQLQSMNHLPSLDLTWLGAHDAPAGMNIKEYTEQILSEQLPSILEQGIARSADVFCEPGWFSLEQSEDILKSSRAGGLELRMHIDEFTDGGGGGLAAELKVASADHAHYTGHAARAEMESAGVNTGFLPGTPYAMGAQWPNFNESIENDFTWSIATDFNPNCKTISLPFLGSLLAQRCSVHPLAALIAATRNPSETTPHPSGKVHGRIQEGGVANFNVLNAPYWEAWCLQPSDTPFVSTCVNGKLIHH
ncbi:MAG: hypothetical protein OSA21_04310 [Candidatus Poseidoniaceae archaeon]|nr:hypothetical protein [Candidatus Poseidoniaceae archaeon]